MQRTLIVIVCLALMMSALSAGAAQRGSLPKAEAQQWVRYTVPLPKFIEILDKVGVPKGTVRITPPKECDQVVNQAIKELNVATGGPASGTGSFTLVLDIGGPDADTLKALKNSDQAYRIFQPQRGVAELKLVALTSRGLYYAAKTLEQLINGRATQTDVLMPIVTVTDWPDLEDRGLWGTDNYDHLKWMGNRKLNWVEQISNEGVEPDGKPYARLKEGREPLITEGPLYGIKPVPATLHLEQVSGKGVFAAYPNLKGNSKRESVWCYSQPEAAKVIAGWIVDLTNLPNVSEVDVWMTENLSGIIGCQCNLCKPTGVDPMVLESRAIVKGWQMARQQTGKDIGLRVLTSEATEDFNKQILAELPKDVKLVYYHSLLTYTTGRQPMLRPYLAEAAKNGRWMAPCPSVDSMTHFTQPFTGDRFIHYRLKEFVDKHQSGILGYATPRVHYNRYNVEAMAEYAWNVNGRSSREFALSWAVRQGLKNPKLFADYAETVGPVLWDIYGSDWPWRAANWILKPIDQRLKTGEVPDLGFVLWDFIRAPFGNISTERQLNDDVVAADRGVKLAKQMGIEEFIQESVVCQGYIRTLKALYELKGLVKNGSIAPSDMYKAKRAFQAYVDGFRQAQAALPKWEKTIMRPVDEIIFTEKPVRVIRENLVDPMIKTAKELGIEVK